MLRKVSNANELRTNLYKGKFEAPTGTVQYIRNKTDLKRYSNNKSRLFIEGSRVSNASRTSLSDPINSYRVRRAHDGALDFI